MKPSRKAIYKDGDRTWSWKFILRILTVVLAAVGIGCVAWAFTTSSGRFEDGYYSDFYGTVLVPWALIPVSIPPSDLLERQIGSTQAHIRWKQTDQITALSFHSLERRQHSRALLSQSAHSSRRQRWL